MLTKLLLKLSPLTKYLTIIGLVGAFLCGGYVTRLYYKSELAELDASYSNRVTTYLNRVIELDKDYINKMTNIKDNLIILNKELINELQKPDYNCPVPDTGIKLLNDAISATDSKRSR